MVRNKNLLIFTYIFFVSLSLLGKMIADVPLDNETKVELNFENAELNNVLNYIEKFFDVTFLPDDAVLTEKKTKGIKDLKITFKSNKPFTKTQVLEFLDLILEISNLARIPAADLPNFYRITNIANSNKTYLPTFISKDINELPNEGRIRYLYFSKNRSIIQLKEIIQKLQSKNAQIDIFPDSNALLIADEAYNVKSLLQIIKELDAIQSPEILTIIKLKNTDVNEILKIYESLKGKNDTGSPFQEKAGGKFTQETKAIADNRTNSLILFGPKNEVNKIEKFIVEHIDVELNKISQNIHFHKLNYAKAESVAKIMNSVVQYGGNSETGKAGGVKGGEQYISNLFFEADKLGNNLVIKGPLREYNLIRGTIEQLDVSQPQVALEVYIVSINLSDIKTIESQIRNKNLGKLNYQYVDKTVVVNPVTGSLLGNLLSLATSFTAGTTIMTLGKADVWALLAVLQEKTKSNIISNPFLVTASGNAAKISFGTQRRVVTSSIVTTGSTTQNTFGTSEATVSVSIIPQINSFGIISLGIEIHIEEFNSTDITSPDMTKRQINTKIKIADGESIALGGLTMNTQTSTRRGIPVIENIPFIGNLFSFKSTDIEKNNLMVFISPKIINNNSKNVMNNFTKKKTNDINKLLDESQTISNLRDPINRWFFKEPNTELKNMFGEFMNGNVPETENKVLKNINKKKSKLISSVKIN